MVLNKPFCHRNLSLNQTFLTKVHLKPPFSTSMVDSSGLMPNMPFVVSLSYII